MQKTNAAPLNKPNNPGKSSDKKAKNKEMEQFYESIDAKYDDSSVDKLGLLKELEAKHAECPDDVGVLWRLVKCCLVVADMYEGQKNKAEAKKYIEASHQHAKKAVEVGPNDFDAHMWYCAAVGRMAPLAGTKDRIKFGHEFKEHRDLAMAIDPSNTLMCHMYGRWCYEVAGLSYIERKIAETFFAAPPVSSYDEALTELTKAEAWKPLGWKSNKLWLAKTMIAMKNYTEAIKAADAGLALPTASEEDTMVQLELKDIEYKYSKYRK